uniref:Rieske (Fe-S) domain containing n=1 Tax=Hucho hucho TaxID=62062 RepID=A0A4W5MRV7_9TELE
MRKKDLGVLIGSYRPVCVCQVGNCVSKEVIGFYNKAIFSSQHPFHIFHIYSLLHYSCTLVGNEEFDGKLCIVCPKHKYKISLAEGEGIYRATNSYAPVPTTRWYSKGIKQRVHTVTETNGAVYVTLSHVSRFIESDYFQGEKGKVERERMEAEDSSKKSNTTS